MIIWFVLVFGVMLMGMGGFVVYRKMGEEVTVSYIGSENERLVQAIQIHLDRGYGEDEIREELGHIGWPKQTIEKGFDAYHYTMLKPAIDQRLSQGKTVHAIKQDFVAAGWNAQVMDRVLAFATGKKIGPDPLDKISEELDKIGEKVKKAK